MRSSRPLVLTFLAIAVALPSAAASCGGSGKGSGGSTSTGGAGGTGGTTTGGGGDDGGLFDQGAPCLTGEACGDGGVCAGGGCCPVALACGGACCSAGAVCSFQQCVTPGTDCHDSTDCAANEYCEFSLGDNGDAGTADAACPSGAPLLNGKCLPRPPTCAADAGTPDSGALTCLEQCEYHPTGTFNPTLRAAWGGMITSPFSTDVMMAPIVIALADTNCDGKVNAQDIPDIVFTSFTGGDYQENGTLHAVQMQGGQLVDQWSASGVYPGTSLAGGNIDGVPGNEVVACGTANTTIAFKGDGTILWTAPYACYMPSIADIDGDGSVEVIVEGGILDGATGNLKHAFSTPLDSHFVVSDIDGDGVLDIVTASRAYHADGTLFVDTKLGGAWPAVADFDHDGIPEVVLIDTTNHALTLWHYDASMAGDASPLGGFKVVRAAVDMNSQFTTNHCPSGSYGYTHGGGPPTVADFNGDGTPDVGLAGGIGYVVFDGQKLLDTSVAGPQTILWSSPTTDCSSAQTGSTVFDFQGTGKAQVVYSDEEYLRIYDGPTGNVLWQTCNTTGTLVEFPVVADVDNDGHADIVVASNAYASGNAEFQCNDGAHNAQSGVRVFGDANGTWVRTPSVWNEHAYHVTNVTADGEIPQHEPANYSTAGLDNFRQNKQPGGEFSAPDAVISVAALCPGPTGLVATVRNIGQAALPAGVVVGFYEGTPPSGTLLGHAQTVTILYPAESEAVPFTLTSPDQGLVSGTTPVYAVADDGMPAHASWHECRTDNNTSSPVSAKCQTAQ